MNVGKKLREERINCEITQKELAKRAGLSTSYVCDIEVGRTNPSLNTLEKLSIALEIEINVLIK